MPDHFGGHVAVRARLPCESLWLVVSLCHVHAYICIYMSHALMHTCIYPSMHPPTHVRTGVLRLGERGADEAEVRDNRTGAARPARVQEEVVGLLLVLL